VLEERARIKKREFIVIAHGIRVNQVQDQARAKEEINKQNRKLQEHVEILRLAWRDSFALGVLQDLSILELQSQSRQTSSLIVA
jgi:hypothetical protein